MSLQDLVALSGVPGLHYAVTLLTSTYSNLENIKLYKQQCHDLSGRCVSLMLALREGSQGLQGTSTLEHADEIEEVIRRINRKVYEWASLSRLRSFLSQREIKDGIDCLHRDIDAAIMRFHVHVGMGLARNQVESAAIRARDQAEIRDLLQKIVSNNDDMKALLSMQSSRPVEEIMESLQTELMDPDLQPVQGEDFRDSLWMLHQKTSKLPPLTDLTGQITPRSSRTVAKGTFHDIYAGTWLNNEQVALRLPRTLANDANVQKRFQREVSIWRNLNHPNVVPLYGIVYIEDELYSVCPWMDNGTSISFVQQNPGADRLRILSEVASGLEYLHDYGIVHGDLRAANVLISKDNVARLADFGLSKLLEDCGQGMTASPNVNPRWFAPELLLHNGPLSTHSDVWSFGMFCLELLSGEQPYANISRDVAVLREIDQGKLPKRPERLGKAHDEMWTLIKTCWNKNPELRPSIAEIKIKLLQMRGMVIPELHTPQKKRSIFSFRRSSQSKDARPTSSGSNASTTLSELSRGSGSESLRNFSVPSRQETRPGDNLSIIIESDSSCVYSTHNPNHKSRINSAPPKLDLSHLSASSLPASSRVSNHFPQRSASTDYPSPMRSVISNDSGIFMTPSQREAVTTPKLLVNLSPSGSVSSGTLEGLVDRLINNFNLRKDLEYRDILLTACADFTTPEDLFIVLARRFQESELDSLLNPEDRIAQQYNIFMVLTYWLSSRRLQVDQQLLWQMRNFCEAAMHKKTSTLMLDKIGDLLHLIDERPTMDSYYSSMNLSPGRRIPDASEILPDDLAIALTLLEGDRYRNIAPSDYIAHLKRHPGPNNVEAAYMTNNKIVLWVKQSILHYDEVEFRGDVLKFLINTADACRRRRNFMSLTAIAIALHSAPIERLKRTIGELPPHLKRKYEELEDIYDISSDHRAYRDAVANKGIADAEWRDYCIPWLPIHLRELHQVLRQNPTVVEIDGQPLINFERYIRFTDRVREVLHFTPPDLERYRQRGQLAYLEAQLRGVHLTTSADEELMERSIALEARETRDYKGRRRELRSLGFDTSKY